MESIYYDVMHDGNSENPSRVEYSSSYEKKRSRATLIICKTVSDVKQLEKYFIDKGIDPSDIATYTRGDKDKSKIKEASEGKIIIATNLAGRGTDIDASSIEKSGGLHVILSFLPANQRIQDQAFGRTSRNGLSGSSRLIIRKEEIGKRHYSQEFISILKVCNDLKNTRISNQTISYQNSDWTVKEDSIVGGRRILQLQKVDSPNETKELTLLFRENAKMPQRPYAFSVSYNTVLINGEEVSINKKSKLS